MAQTFEEQYEQMVKKQLAQMMHSFLQAQKSAKQHGMPTPTKSTSAAADQQDTAVKSATRGSRQAASYQGRGAPASSLALSEVKPRDKAFQLDLANLNEVDLPREPEKPTYLVRPNGSRGGYIDRARRSIKNESRQTNVVDLISSFNQIPKQQEIKFDFVAVIEQQQEENKDHFDAKKYERSEIEIESLPVLKRFEAAEDDNQGIQTELAVQGSNNFHLKHNLNSNAEESCSEGTEHTFLRDYSGKDFDLTNAQIEEVKMEEQEPNGDLIEHILDRLVTMLMLPSANSEQDFIAEDYLVGDDEPNYESLLMQKIRLSGQAKSVRCLSSHIRQTSIKLRDKSKGADDRDYRGQLISCASKGQGARAVSNERRGQSLERTEHFQTMSRSRVEDASMLDHSSARRDDQLTTSAQYSHPNRRHFKAPLSNHVSLATPVVNGVKSSEIDSSEVLVPPFEYLEGTRDQTAGDSSPTRNQNQGYNFRNSVRRHSGGVDSEAAGSVKKQANPVQRNTRTSLTSNQMREAAANSSPIAQQTRLATQPTLIQKAQMKISNGHELSDASNKI